jgi:peptide/nickel transport system substrate-binding protein
MLQAADRRHDPSTLVVIEPSDANTINPLFAHTAAATMYGALVLDPLVNVGPGFSFVPWLATNWTSTPDGLHWRVTLRRGVRWSDGAPFDSRDVVWTWKAMLDPATGFSAAGQFDYVRDVVARGPYEVAFDLKRTGALFVSQALNVSILPQHVLGRIPMAQQRSSTFGERPVGTGPYMLARWDRDSEAVFVRNPHWWHGPVSIPRIDVRIVLNEQARVEALEDGSADLDDNMSAAAYRTVQEDDPQLRRLHLPDLYVRFMMVNLHVPGLDSVAVRRAMMFGWDRASLAHGLLHDDVTITSSIVPVALAHWYNPHVAQYPYDPVRARATLDAAGWKPGRDGIRRKGKIRLDFELLLPSGGTTGAEVGAEFQADMAAIGIAISVRQLDYVTFIDDTNAFKYQIALTGWGGTTDPDEFTFLHSSQIVPIGNNGGGYKNRIVDRDLVMGLRTLGPANRKRWYDEMQRVTAETLPELWGWAESYRVAYVPRLDLDAQTALPDNDLWYDVWRWKLSG